MKIALVADWLVSYGGAEGVLLAISDIFPKAEIFTSVYNPEKLPQFHDKKIITSWLQYIPSAKNHAQYFFPLLPKIFESFDLNDYDLIISSSHSFAKGINPPKKAFHICYCYTPTRYLWFPKIDQRISGKNQFFFKLFVNRLKTWDLASARRVNKFVAISKTVQKRIKKIYNKESIIIHSPIEANRFSLSKNVDSYYLTGGRLIPYKKIDLVIVAFNQLKLPLKVMGTGPEESKLKAIANKNIEFLGFISDQERAKYYRRAQAFIFPGEEDLGLTPLESMASGRPVIGYGVGGASETIISGRTGELFRPQSVAALVKTIKKFRPKNYDPEVCRNWAKKFDVTIFKKKFKNFVEKEYNKFKTNKGE